MAGRYQKQGKKVYDTSTGKWLTPEKSQHYADISGGWQHLPDYKAPTAQPTLIEITSQRPDVLAEARKHGGDPYTAGTEANKWLNDWYNRVGRAEGADMASKGMFDRPETKPLAPVDGVVDGGIPIDTKEKYPDDTVDNELENNQFFQQLDDDSKDIMRYYWSILESQDEQKMDAFNEAMDLAKDRAGPYWREKINILTDEVKRTFGTLEADIESREKSLSRRIQQIRDDLEYERENLSVSEQAELKKIKGEYEVEIENTRSTMAERGLSSSTIRTKAEERMSEKRTDIVESTQRQYARAQRSLRLGSSRMTEDIEQEVEDLQRRMKEKKTDIGRKTEEYLGSEEAGKIPGLGDYISGDISGTLVEDKSRDVLERAKGLMLSSY